MQPHEERVVTERKELNEKLEKLHLFCFSTGDTVFRKLSPEDRDLLEDQYTVMKQYCDILDKRIAHFKI